MKILKLVLFIEIIFLLSGCKSQNRISNEDYLQPFKEEFQFLEKYDWNVIVEFMDQDELELYADVIIGDTLLMIKGRRFKDTEEIVYELTDVNKVFNRDNTIVDIQTYDSDFRLNFWYQVNKSNQEEKVFIIGKYYFQFKNGLLTPDQQEYFLTHKDSLIHVKGDKLPNLPEG